MADFVLFMRAFWVGVKFLRGVIVSLLVCLAGCAVIISLKEKMPLATSMYFVLVTAFTIGYGDIVPSTVLGRIVSLVAGGIGIMTTGLTTALAVSAVQRAFMQRIREAEGAGGALGDLPRRSESS